MGAVKVNITAAFEKIGSLMPDLGIKVEALINPAICLGLLSSVTTIVSVLRLTA